MIDYIKGELAELTPAQAVVEAYGVGYALNISLNTYEAIQGKENVKLFVHEALVTGGRDDSYTFYGFASKQERDLYRLLITVSGVGANTARMILSSASPSELCNAISTSNERASSAFILTWRTMPAVVASTCARVVLSMRRLRTPTSCLRTRLRRLVYCCASTMQRCACCASRARNATAA